MEPRLDYKKIEPEANQIMASLERFIKASGLEQPLLELVKLRAS